MALLAAPALVHPLRHLHSLATLCSALFCLTLAISLWLARLALLGTGACSVRRALELALALALALALRLLRWGHSQKSLGR